jgi:hypothetical protein
VTWIWKLQQHDTNVVTFCHVKISLQCRTDLKSSHMYADSGSVLVKALCYKLEGHGFQTQWGEFIFSIYLILPASLGSGVCSASNRNEYQKQKNKVSREWNAAGAEGRQTYPHLWADCLVMWDPQHLSILLASMACYGDSFTLLYFTLQWRLWGVQVSGLSRCVSRKGDVSE